MSAINKTYTCIFKSTLYHLYYVFWTTNVTWDNLVVSIENNLEPTTPSPSPLGTCSSAKQLFPI